MSDLSRRELNRIAREKTLLDAALVVFVRAGYSGASMDSVAAEAGMTKPTLYKYFDSKEALFTAMMEAQRDNMLLAFDDPKPAMMVRQLHTFAWGYAKIVMRPDMLSLARLIIGETQRFPEIGRAYQAAGPDRVFEGMVEYLSVLRDAGRLVFEEADLAAQDLWGLVLSGVRTRALYEPESVPETDEISRAVNNGLRVFLRAYSADVEADLVQLETVITA